MSDKIFKWSVVGAGPAGIMAVAKLIDAGVPAQQILWLDPHFQVGDFGRLWSQVSGNTPVQSFIDCLQFIECIPYGARPFPMHQLAPSDTCQLSYMADILQHYSDELRPLTVHHQANLQALALKNNMWQLTSDQNEVFEAQKVVLATGAIPKMLSLSDADRNIPLEIALSPDKLAGAIQPDDTIAVFGSSHSAILILKNLVDLSAAKIINFYLEPCRYALPMGDWILYDNTGLKGKAAKWAKTYVDGKWPDNLQRLYSNKENIEAELPKCQKVIHATGFSTKLNFTIEGVDAQKYDPYSGIIAPGLFGFGIAFPHHSLTPFGNVTVNVGLRKFKDHLQKVLPIWLQYDA